MNPDREALYQMLQAKMTKAFKLVEPPSHWKNPIDAVVTTEQLREAGLTIGDVAEAVAHFTGTPATIEQAPSWVSLEPLYHVTAIGYFAGPCN